MFRQPGYIRDAPGSGDRQIGCYPSHPLQYDAPLTSDVTAYAAINSAWVQTSTSAEDLARLGAINALSVSV